MKKIKVGVVDDNLDFCEVVRDYLKKQENIEVLFTAPDGVKAMEYLKTEDHCPDILILDLIMPHMDGFGSATLCTEGYKEMNPIPISANLWL